MTQYLKVKKGISNDHAKSFLVKSLESLYAVSKKVLLPNWW